jgi:hypothetical protein
MSRGIGKKKRFEIFKRDSFQCQYCGASAPEVILEIDHIKPVSKGGKNDIVNLITSCFDCNRGKGNRELSDNSVARKSIDEIRRQKERLEQSKMIVQWKEESLKVEDYQLEKIRDILDNTQDGYIVSEIGEKTIRRCLKRFTFQEVYEAAEISSSYYHTVHEAVTKLGGICYNRRKQCEDSI